MSRDISSASLREINAVSSGEGWLMLLEIITDTETIRVVNDNKQVSSGGVDYFPYAFAVQLYNDTDEELPRIQVVIDNIDRLLVEAIRTMLTPPVVHLRMVPISDPDSPELVILDTSLRDIRYNAETITGIMSFGDMLNQRFPKDRYTPITTPGLF